MTVQDLIAKQDIYEVIARYARAIDRLDEPMLRSVFHRHSTHNHFIRARRLTLIVSPRRTILEISSVLPSRF